MSYGYIYQIINIINNHSYIGYTNNFMYRMQKHYSAINQSNLVLYRAIRKYGINNFVVKILEQPLLHQLQEREKYWIKFFNTRVNGYNMTDGGDGGAITTGMHPHNYISITKQQSNKIKTLRAKHYSVKEISKIVSCSENVVWREIGIGAPPVTKKDRINKIALKHDLLNKDIPIKVICQKYELSCNLLTKLTLEIFNHDVEFIRHNIHRKPRRSK